MNTPFSSHVTIAFPKLLELQAPGISVAAISYQRNDGQDSIGVRGFFRYPLKGLICPTDSFRMISILVVSGPRHVPFAFSFGKDKIFFEDDLRQVGGDIAGVFECDVFEGSGVQPVAGESFVTASIGPYISQVSRLML